MNEKEIQSFSLETLLTVNEPRPEDLYFDGCLIASRVKIMDTCLLYTSPSPRDRG